MARIYPSGKFNVQHFGAGAGQIRVKHTADGKVVLKLGRAQKTVSNEFYLSRLEKQEAYRDTRDFFQSFEAGTKRGIEATQKRYKENFDRAIRSKYSEEYVPEMNYLTQLWNNMTNEQRDAFTEAYPETVREIFRYEESNAKQLDTNGGYDETDDITDYTDPYVLINRLEQYANSNLVERLRRRYL